LETDLKIVAITTNEYGERFVSHIKAVAPASWTVLGYSHSQVLPLVMDDPSQFVPQDLPSADLLLYLGQNRQLAELLPDIAAACGVGAVVAPVDNHSFLPRGLANQIKKQLAKLNVEVVFPAPFCSLTERTKSNPLLKEFATHFGRARLRVAISGEKVDEVEVLRGAPCGNTHFVAEGLPGVELADAAEETARLFHSHPCMASMEMDLVVGDTLLHIAGYLVKGAVKRAIAKGTESDVSA